MKLIPVFLVIVGTASGVGAGLFLVPQETPEAAEQVETAMEDERAHDTQAKMDPAGEHVDASGLEYVKLNNQFVIPVVSEGHVRSHVVMSLSLEVGAGATEEVYAREPKLIDGFLQALFDHANIGGFEGNFTESEKIELLRKALLFEAKKVLGTTVFSVLITNLARQDT